MAHIPLSSETDQSHQREGMVTGGGGGGGGGDRFLFLFFTKSSVPVGGASVILSPRYLMMVAARCL